VRYGIRSPSDRVIVDSLKVVDSVLLVETPFGPCWHRYNHDGYGQRDDGGPYQGWGKGRAWPLLTGERGHYELSAGRKVAGYIQTIERLASASGLIPEQIWDEPDRKEKHFLLGRPTGSAMPLVWAHAEYIKLLRSLRDGKVFDLIPEVESRYIRDRSRCKSLEVWKFNRQPRTVKRGFTLRVEASQSFRLHWSKDDWRSTEAQSSSTSLQIHFTDIDISLSVPWTSLRFTFPWTDSNTWEGRDYHIGIG
jgi:glucoamylase